LEDSIMTSEKATVIGVLLLAVLTNTAVADRGDGWPAHGSGSFGGIAVSVGGDGWFISYRHGERHHYDRGYAAGKSGGWRAGYEDGFRGRRHRPTPHGFLRGRSHDFRRGYFRGYAVGYERGFREGRSKRFAHRRWQRPVRGWVTRPPRGWPRHPPRRRRPH
jgi:hypothetical protein